MSKRRTGRVVAGLAVTTALLLSGCSSFSGIYDLPLPGGADLGDHPYTVKVQLRDALDLVPQAGVKVNEVQVGRVDEIGLAADGWTAEVTVLVNGDVRLPANALAKLRQSSLLGEKYIELSPPDKPEGTLADNAVITVDRTNRNTEVEEVLGALSLLLNGGGIDQLQTIAKELNSALEGNEPQLRKTMENVNTLVTGLDAHRSDITDALDGLNRLSLSLNAQKGQLAHAIDNLGPGLQVLAEQRGQLVTMLQSLDSLSGVAVQTLDKSQEDLIADLKALQPTLQKLGEAGANLPKSLELLLTFPFTDAAADGVKGDYFNLYAKVDLNLQDLVDNFSRSRQNPLQDIPIIGGLTSPKPGSDPNAQPPLEIPGQTGSQQPGASPAQPSRGTGTGVGSIFGNLLGGGA